MKVPNKHPLSVKNSSKQRTGLSFSLLTRKKRKTETMSKKSHIHKKSFSKSMPRQQYHIIYEMNIKFILIVVLYILPWHKKKSITLLILVSLNHDSRLCIKTQAVSSTSLSLC